MNAKRELGFACLRIASTHVSEHCRCRAEMADGTVAAEGQWDCIAWSSFVWYLLSEFKHGHDM